MKTNQKKFWGIIYRLIPILVITAAIFVETIMPVVQVAAENNEAYREQLKEEEKKEKADEKQKETDTKNKAKLKDLIQNDDTFKYWYNNGYKEKNTDAVSLSTLSDRFDSLTSKDISDFLDSFNSATSDRKTAEGLLDDKDFCQFYKERFGKTASKDTINCANATEALNDWHKAKQWREDILNDFVNVPKNGKLSKAEIQQRFDVFKQVIGHAWDGDISYYDAFKYFNSLQYSNKHDTLNAPGMGEAKTRDQMKEEMKHATKTHFGRFLYEWEDEILGGQIDIVKDTLLPGEDPTLTSKDIDKGDHSMGYYIDAQKQKQEKTKSWYDRLKDIKPLQNLGTYMQGFGYILCFFIILYKLVRNVLDDHGELRDLLLKMAIEAFFALFMVTNANWILDKIDWLISIVTGLMKDQLPAVSSITLTEHPLLGDFDDTSLAETISNAAGLFIPHLLTSITDLATRVLCLGILIELQMRRILVPFALGNTIRQGKMSVGLQFLKAYAICYLKSGMIIIMATICSYLTVVAFNSPVNFVCMIITLKALSVVLIIQLGKWIEDII